MALEKHSGDGYQSYTQDHDYTDVPGVVIAPSSNRDGDARLLRVHGRYGTRTVKWAASRTGAPPLLPAVGDTPGDTFIAATVSLPLPVADAGRGLFHFGASGAYVYLQKTARIPGLDPLPTGGYPYPLATQGTVAAIRYASEIAGAVGNPNPASAVVAAAGVNYDGSATTGWYLTGLPAQTFVSYLISG